MLRPHPLRAAEEVREPSPFVAPGWTYWQPQGVFRIIKNQGGGDPSPKAPSDSKHREQ